MEKITIDDLLGAAKLREKNKTFEVELEQEGLEGKVLTCRVLTRDEIFEALDSKDPDLEVTYMACDMFRDNRLVEGLNCKQDPRQVVTKMLDPDTIYSISALVMAKSGATSRKDFAKIVEEDAKK